MQERNHKIPEIAGYAMDKANKTNELDMKNHRAAVAEVVAAVRNVFTSEIFNTINQIRDDSLIPDQTKHEEIRKQAYIGYVVSNRLLLYLQNIDDTLRSEALEIVGKELQVRARRNDMPEPPPLETTWDQRLARGIKFFEIVSEMAAKNDFTTDIDLPKIEVPIEKTKDQKLRESRKEDERDVRQYIEERKKERAKQELTLTTDLIRAIGNEIKKPRTVMDIGELAQVLEMKALDTQLSEQNRNSLIQSTIQLLIQATQSAMRSDNREQAYILKEAFQIYVMNVKEYLKPDYIAKSQSTMEKVAPKAQSKEETSDISLIESAANQKDDSIKANSRIQRANPSGLFTHSQIHKDEELQKEKAQPPSITVGSKRK